MFIAIFYKKINFINFFTKLSLNFNFSKFFNVSTNDALKNETKNVQHKILYFLKTKKTCVSVIYNLFIFRHFANVHFVYKLLMCSHIIYSHFILRHSIFNHFVFTDMSFTVILYSDFTSTVILSTHTLSTVTLMHLL
jgi:hypothetical protein